MVDPTRDTHWLREGARSDLVRPKPKGRPHVLAIVLDDTGFGHLGCFGSTISTPNIDRLAAEGLRYSRFHVTAMCSPTRASFFTGRNAHRVGMGFVADIPLDHPGYTGRIHPSAATTARGATAPAVVVIVSCCGCRWARKASTTIRKPCSPT